MCEVSPTARICGVPAVAAATESLEVSAEEKTPRDEQTENQEAGSKGSRRKPGFQSRWARVWEPSLAAPGPTSVQQQSISVWAAFTSWEHDPVIATLHRWRPTPTPTTAHPGAGGDQLKAQC